MWYLFYGKKSTECTPQALYDKIRKTVVLCEDYIV